MYDILGFLVGGKFQVKLASIIFSFLLLTQVATAQVDTEKTSKGDLKITSITHGTVMFEFGGKVIDVDPISMGADWGKYPKADWVFITDTEKTSKGDLKITSITHGTVMFEFGGKVIDVILR